MVSFSHLPALPPVVTTGSKALVRADETKNAECTQMTARSLMDGIHKRTWKDKNTESTLLNAVLSRYMKEKETTRKGPISGVVLAGLPKLSRASLVRLLLLPDGQFLPGISYCLRKEKLTFSKATPAQA